MVQTTNFVICNGSMVVNHESVSVNRIKRYPDCLRSRWTQMSGEKYYSPSPIFELTPVETIVGRVM